MMRPFVKILSIDGGGVRGIIPALVMDNLQSRLPSGVSLAKQFNIITGTSAGGILTLLLTTPGDNGNPKYTTSFIATEIITFSQTVFAKSIIQSIKSLWGLTAPSYSVTPLETLLESYFGTAKLNQTITNVVVPAYEIEQQETILFENQDCFLKDVARATSAAPTYFSAAAVTTGSGTVYHCVDGGIAINNPTIAAMIRAFEIYKTKDIDFLIVSLGTGTEYKARTRKFNHLQVMAWGLVQWATKILNLVMYAPMATVDYEVNSLLNTNQSQCYFRLQPVIEPEYDGMDDVSSTTLTALQNYATDLIKANDSDLDYIAKSLMSDTYIPHSTVTRTVFN